MTIKRKLGLIIASLVISFAAVLALYFKILEPINKMAQGEVAITVLSNAINKRKLAANQLLSAQNLDYAEKASDERPEGNAATVHESRRSKDTNVRSFTDSLTLL